MSWECPECGESNSDDSIAVCFCGFNRDELVDDPVVLRAASVDKEHTAPGHTRKVLWKIFKFIFVVHFVAWSVVMIKQTTGRPYVLARAVMTNAVVLTGFYIRPLRKIIGAKNPLLKPLIITRDFIFDIGWDLFPADDADREFYWYANYGNRALLLKSIDSYNSTDKRKNLFTDQEYEDYFYQLNKHLSNLVNLPMRDKKDRSMRYFYFGVTAKRYNVMYGIYLSKKHNVDYYFEPDSEYLKNIREQFELFLQVRKKTKSDSPKTYEAFLSRKDDWWYSMQRYVLGAANDIIVTNVIQEKFNCVDQVVVEFLESRQSILLYAPRDRRPKISEHSKRYIAKAIYNFYTFGKGTTFNFLKNNCNTPAIQSFTEYPQKIKETTNVSN